MSNVEASQEAGARHVARLMGSTFVLADLMLLGGLGFGYVLPRLLAFPDLSLVELGSAAIIVVLLGVVQVFLLPIIAILFGFRP
ncbi:hypothetical protein [Halorussus litoreus]|uniref:hypothetical protein n=1 Tax=Halorussus litoreus TaxID=1710536 RepID=UPI000E229E1C|nr:hypothetical protein [Halorussus litoreus]